MFLLESSRKGENIVPVLFYGGNASHCSRATPAQGYQTEIVEPCGALPRKCLFIYS
jgi:hypothetical protein